MNYPIIFKRINDVCAEMLSVGGYPEAVSRKIQYIHEQYGFTESVVSVNTNCVFSYAIDPDGNPVSSINPIEFGESNFSKMNLLNKYCQTIIDELPDAESIALSLAEINNKKYISKLGECIASVLGGTGFAVMFGCNLNDCLTAAVACLLIVFIGGFIKKYSDNLFLYNAIMSLIVETLILSSYKFVGVCEHPDRISLGVIMLLISGLGVVDGLTSLINKDSSIGFHKINNSIVGAMGIAMGISLPLLLIGMNDFEGFVLHDNFIVQTLACTIACVGFGMVFRVEKKYLPYVAICSCITWLTYSVVYSLKPSLFLATFVAAAVEAIITMLFSVKLGIISMALLTVSLFPLVPGPNLFYVLYGAVTKDRDLLITQLGELIITCLAISFGYCCVRFLYKMISTRKKKDDR